MGNRGGWSLLALVVVLVACGDPAVVEGTTSPGVETTADQATSVAPSTTSTPSSTIPLAASTEHFDGQPIGWEPIRVEPGETVTVVIDGMNPNAVVEVGLDNRYRNPLGEPVADGDGVVRFTFELPEATPGVHSLELHNTEGVIKGKVVRLLYPGLPKVGDGYSVYVCCFEPPEGYESAKVEFGNERFGMLELPEGGVEPEGGMLAPTVVLPGSIGDPAMTIRLTNTDTGQVIEHEVELRPNDFDLGLTIRQVALNIREKLHTGEAPEFADDLFSRLDMAYDALNIPGFTTEIADIVLSNDWFTIDSPKLEDLDPETQALLKSLTEVEVDDPGSVYDLHRGSDRRQAAEHILEAAHLIDQGGEVGAWSSGFADEENDLLAAAARGLARLAILEAEDDGLEEEQLESGLVALDEGDAHRRQSNYAESIAAYANVFDILR